MRPSSPGACLLEGVSWLRTMSDTRKDCGSAIRTGMAIKKIAIPNSLKSIFIWLFPDASPFVYTRLRGKGFLCEVVRSGSLAAFLTFNLISRHKGTKFPEANAGGAFCRPARQADNRTRADVHKPCSLVGRLFPFSVNLRGFR